MPKTNLLWSEEYRPRSIDECILPKELKASFQAIVDQKCIPNMLLSGTSGLGKTTVARALCNELNADYIIINGSEDSGIDVLRTRIRQFASTTSLMDSDLKQKVVILDEADYLNVNSTQPALRGFIEEFSKVCRFIFTCNFKNKIIDQIHSRCKCIDFSFNSKVKADLAAQMHKRVSTILTENEVEFDKRTLADIIVEHAPDWRRVLNEVQGFSQNGALTPDVVNALSSDRLDGLLTSLKDKKHRDMRNWVAQNSDIDTAVLYRRVYDSLCVKAEPSSIPTAILILAEYESRSPNMPDKELNNAACFTELMRDVKFRS